MNETPFFFKGDGYRLFGVIHDPEVEPNSRGFVFCHPFAEEKLWTHRVFVNFARILVQKGYHVLRFDYMGNGDSEGDFSDSSVEIWLSDIQSAVAWLRTNRQVEGGIGLLGLRFGATLAAFSAERDPGIGPLILWEAIDSGAQYVRELIRINLATQSAVYREIRQNTEALVDQLTAGGIINIDGYDIRYPLYEQMMAIKLSDRQYTYAGNVLLVQINRKDGTGLKRVEGIASRYTQPRCIEVAEQPFWKEIREYYAHAKSLFEATTRWITDNA